MDCTASLSCIGWASCSSQDQHHKIVPGWTFVCRISFKNIDTKDIFIQIRTQQGRYPFLYTIQQKIYKLDKLKKRKKNPILQTILQKVSLCKYLTTALKFPFPFTSMSQITLILLWSVCLLIYLPLDYSTETLVLTSTSHSALILLSLMCFLPSKSHSAWWYCS